MREDDRHSTMSHLKLTCLIRTKAKRKSWTRWLQRVSLPRHAVFHRATRMRRASSCARYGKLFYEMCFPFALKAVQQEASPHNTERCVTRTQATTSSSWRGIQRSQIISKTNAGSKHQCGSHFLPPSVEYESPPLTTIDVTAGGGTRVRQAGPQMRPRLLRPAYHTRPKTRILRGAGAGAGAPTGGEAYRRKNSYTMFHPKRRREERERQKISVASWWERKEKRKKIGWGIGGGGRTHVKEGRVVRNTQGRGKKEDSNNVTTRKQMDRPGMGSSSPSDEATQSQPAQRTVNDSRR